MNKEHIKTYLSHFTTSISRFQSFEYRRYPFLISSKLLSIYFSLLNQNLPSHSFKLLEIWWRLQTRELNRMGIHTEEEDRHLLVLAIFNGNIKDPRDFVVNFIPPDKQNYHLLLAKKIKIFTSV